MKILMDDGIWEKDFLLNEILPKDDIDISFIDYNDNYKFIDVFIFCSRRYSFSSILDVVKKITPKIIICLSDEFITEDLNEFNQLGNYCKLFLRQYHHPEYTYTSNTIHIPLGYTNECKVFSENKQLNWSFFGNIKTDRQEMIEKFRNIPRHFVGNSVSKEVMCKIYSKSIFVSCGRGNSSLDCFRIYEATMNGAIPVVVGPKQEIEFTFKYEENPPWIFSETWGEAVEKCKSLLSQENELKQQQTQLLTWWKNRIEKIQKKVLEVL